MPMLFAAPTQVIRPGRPPQIRGAYHRYAASSFPPGSPIPHGVNGSYQAYSSPSFPPGSPVPTGATASRTKCSAGAGMPAGATSTARVMRSQMHGAFRHVAWNEPPYFSGLGAGTDFVSQATDWISANPLLATGGALALGALLLGGAKRRR